MSEGIPMAALKKVIKFHHPHHTFSDEALSLIYLEYMLFIKNTALSSSDLALREGKKDIDADMLAESIEMALSRLRG